MRLVGPTSKNLRSSLTFHPFAGNWRITRWEDRPDLVVNPYGLPQVTWGQRRLESQ